MIFGRQMAWVVAYGMALIGSAAQAESLLAVPDGATLTLWDTTKYPAMAAVTGLTGGTAGACYQRDGQRFVPDSDITACLSHMRIGDTLITGGADRYDIIGVIAPLDGPVNDFSTCFVVTGVQGVDNCGERGNCDDIYVLGARGEAALRGFAAAVRSGARVRLQGPGAWNLESIDIVIEHISTPN